METRITVSKNIKQLRAEKKWSQEELSFEAGLHRTYISMLERCVRSPTVDVLEKVANALGVSVARLVWDGKSVLPQRQDETAHR